MQDLFYCVLMIVMYVVGFCEGRKRPYNVMQGSMPNTERPTSRED